MADAQVFAEIRAQFSGVCPNVFVRMDEAGALSTHWPEIRSVLSESEPLPSPVVQAMLLVLSLRCAHAYCFVMHWLTLVGQSASAVAIEELARLFDMPPIVPNHQHWSRVIKLAWLTRIDGPQRAAADFCLRRMCSEAEHARMMKVCEVGELLNCFVGRGNVLLEDEPALEQLPEELRSLIPNFVQFHVRMNRADDAQRPVAAICSVCRELRSTDGEWYPHEVARELLADDMLYSHGLCPRCLVEQGAPPELL